MRKSILPILLASVVMPFAAYAQDANPTQPDAAATPPAASDPAKPDTMAPAAPADTTAAPAAPDTSTDAAASADKTPDAGMADKAPDASMADKAPDASTGDAGSAGDTSDKMDQASAATGSDATFVTVPPTGAWRTTDLEGKDVYGSSGESIGSISDVLVNEDGKVNAVLVGVGGFLGIGKKDVAVSMTALKFGPGKTEGLKTAAEADAEASAAAPASGGATSAPAAGGAAPDPSAGGGTGGAPAATAEQEDPVVGEDNLPDRIVLNVTREELESAPAYGEPEGSGDSDSTASISGDAPAASDAASPAAAPADSGGADKPAAQ